MKSKENQSKIVINVLKTLITKKKARLYANLVEQVQFLMKVNLFAKQLVNTEFG